MLENYDSDVDYYEDWERKLSESDDYDDREPEEGRRLSACTGQELSKQRREVVRVLTNNLIYQLDEGAFEPVKGRPHDAGFDLASREDVFLEPEQVYKFDTGVHFHIPEGYAGFILPRSGMSISGVQSVTGVIDCNYTGSVCVLLWRHKASHNVKIFKGQRIAQIVIYAVPNWQLVRGEVQDLHAERGEQGFGSSGL